MLSIILDWTLIAYILARTPRYTFTGALPGSFVVSLCSSRLDRNFMTSKNCSLVPGQADH
jgi:hypothetical protein